MNAISIEEKPSQPKVIQKVGMVSNFKKSPEHYS
jgi:hypothetical protein